jgi:hypothetical protein
MSDSALGAPRELGRQGRLTDGRIVPKLFQCPACGAKAITYLQTGERCACAACHASVNVPEGAEDVVVADRQPTPSLRQTVAAGEHEKNQQVEGGRSGLAREGVTQEVGVGRRRRSGQIEAIDPEVSHHHFLQLSSRHNLLLLLFTFVIPVLLVLVLASFSEALYIEYTVPPEMVVAGILAFALSGCSTPSRFEHYFVDDEVEFTRRSKVVFRKLMVWSLPGTLLRFFGWVLFSFIGGHGNLAPAFTLLAIGIAASVAATVAAFRLSDPNIWNPRMPFPFDLEPGEVAE